MTLLFDAGEAVAAPRPGRRRKAKRRRVATPVFEPLVAPIARDNVLQAERETAQTLRLLDKRAKKVTTRDIKRLLADPVYRGLREYTGLTPDDRVARCECGRWTINPADHGGRADVPPKWAAKARPGVRPVCQACHSRAEGEA